MYKKDCEYRESCEGVIADVILIPSDISLLKDKVIKSYREVIEKNIGTIPKLLNECGGGKLHCPNVLKLKRVEKRMKNIANL